MLCPTVKMILSDTKGKARANLFSRELGDLFLLVFLSREYPLSLQLFHNLRIILHDDLLLVSIMIEVVIQKCEQSAVLPPS